MHVVVVGCGRVGSELAGNLEKAGHTVAIIDKDATAFRRLPSTFTGQKIVGPAYLADHPPHTLIVMSPIYLPEIKADLARHNLHPTLLPVETTYLPAAA